MFTRKWVAASVVAALGLAAIPVASMAKSLHSHRVSSTVRPTVARTTHAPAASKLHVASTVTKSSKKPVLKHTSHHTTKHTPAKHHTLKHSAVKHTATVKKTTAVKKPITSVKPVVVTPPPMF